MLFADESNATSNAIYRSIGYRPVDVFVLARAHARSAA
jgi:predicted GNAT family acetyltransferase